MAVSPHIHLVSRRADLEPYIDEWDELAENPSEPNPFFESWFLLPLLESLEEGLERFLLVRDHDGNLIGFFPFKILGSYKNVPVRYLSILKTPLTFLSTPLVLKHRENYFWREVFSWLRATHRTTLGLELPEFYSACDLSASLFSTLAEMKIPFFSSHSYERAVLRPGLSSAAHFEQCMSAKHRRDLEKKYRKLENECSLPLILVSQNSVGSDIASVFLKLESSGWKGKQGTALACDPRMSRFFSTMIQRGSMKDRIQITSLTLKENPIASLVLLKSRGKIFSFKIAYDESYEKFSPGMLLVRDITSEMLSSQDLLEIDSCAAPGSAIFARLWREKREILTIMVGSRGLLSTLIMHLVCTLGKAVKTVRRYNMVVRSKNKAVQ